MENNYRIHTNIGHDSVLNVKIQQNMDFLEVLTLKISQEDTYRLDNSNYGIIIGRVLANDAFGIPNAKISIFVELKEEDSERTDITNLYNFKTVNDTKDNIRYNLLPNDKDDECYRVIGTFPNKRLVLDDGTVLEVFDKYYKYSTVTNSAGDYMIYGVPTGNTTLHIDIDLSDIGILSQKPRDFIYKGYNEKQFDNAEQFKESTNLDNLSQVISQTQSVYVYPFFGEEGSEEVAITRADVKVQYKFEPTCVFMGSIVTDSYGNSIGDLCNPSRKIGRNSELVTGFGTIEMIRKTIDGLTEEFQIQGNQLIDGDGVWCYQIPMNLDYVGTDEFGNICATDNPSKGIPTRTRVRFRISMSETENDAISRHRAKYLVPNNPILDENSALPKIKNCANHNKHYNFGSTTLDEDYRDLFWNKVYSVKNYIPRVQNTIKPRTYFYTGLRTSNDYGAKNPIPFNKVRFKVPFSYAFLCLVIKVVISLVYFLNLAVICGLNTAFTIFKIIPVYGKKIYKKLRLDCVSFGTSLTANDEDDVEYYPGCSCRTFGDCQNPGCTQRAGQISDLFDVVEQVLAEDYDVVHLDFFNDWLNGCLYAPLWFWKKQKKRSYFFGLFRSRAKNRYCDCDTKHKRLKLIDTCTMNFSGPTDDGGASWDKHHNRFLLNSGLIKNVLNKDNLNIYYYSPGNIVDDKPNEGEDKPFARLFATDIILLGTFNSCDIDGMPQVYDRLPSTTANIPGIKRSVITINESEEAENGIEGSDDESMNSTTIETGMDWLHDGNKIKPKYKNGLLFGIDCTSVDTKPKTCINANRLSELGVSLDTTFQENFAPSKGQNEKVEFEADGLITKLELDDYETRAMFATLNHNGLTNLKIDDNTGYNTYNLRYTYSVDFDGKYSQTILKRYGFKETNDVSDGDYLLFKYGPDYDDVDVNGQKKKNGRVIHNYYNNLKTRLEKDSDIEKYDGNEFFPLYNNSFYFYFGLNEGKTAIDKFRSKFVSKCFQNKKYPFNMDISKKLASSCIKNPLEDGAVIEVNLEGIEMPYSYSLYLASTGDKIVSESGVNTEKLMFGIETEGGKYKVSDDGQYKGSDNKKYVIDGLIHYLTKEGVVHETNGTFGEDGDEWLIENTTYKLSITDANGKTQHETITLAQQPIELNYKNIELGNCFFPKETENNDVNKKTYSVPEDFYEKETYGEFVINSISIDGNDFSIENVEFIDNNEKEKLPNGNEIYEFTLTVLSDANVEYKVQLKIGVNNVYYDQDVRDFSTILKCCDCDEWNTEDKFYFDENDKSIHCNIWVPVTLNVVVTQYCGENDDILTNNSSSYLITIQNGKVFDALINKVPIRFINNKVDTLYDQDVLKIWTNIYDEQGGSYKFPNVLQEETIWSNYIDYDVNYDENDNKTCTDETKYNALYYKFSTIFNLAKSSYFTDNGKNNFNLTSVGGKKQVITQGYYPSYNSFEDIPLYCDGIKNGKIDERYVLNKWSLHSIQPNVSCDYCHPNIISSEIYAKYCDDDYKKISNDEFNSLLTNNSINYFAAFTNNSTKPCDTWPNSKDVKPIKSNNGFEEFDEMPNSPTKYENTIKNWFKTLFIDRRIGYDIAIMSSTLANDADISDINKNGRISIKTIGGIDLAYDYEDVENKFNIIGENSDSKLEYYYDINDNDVVTVYNDKAVDKLFNEVSLTTNLINKTTLTRVMLNSDNSNLLSDDRIEKTYSGEPKLIKDTTNCNGAVYTGEALKRYTDVNNIPNVFGAANITIKSADYPSDVVLEKNGGTFNLKAFCEDTDEIDENFICSNAYTIENTDFIKGDFSVFCTASSSQITPKGVRLCVKPSTDYLTDKMYKVYRPFAIKGNANTINSALDKAKSGKDPFSTYETLNSSSISEMSIVEINGIKDLLNIKKKGKYFYEKENDVAINNIDHEDIYERLKLSLESNKEISRSSLWGQTASLTEYANEAYGKYGMHAINDDEYVMIFGGREYVDDDDMVLLQRRINLFDFSHLYHISPISWGVELINATASVVTSNQKEYKVDYSTSSGSASYVTSVSSDGKGNVSSTSSSSDFVTDVSVYDTEKEGKQIEVTIKLRITVNDPSFVPTPDNIDVWRGFETIGIKKIDSVRPSITTTVTTVGGKPQWTVTATSRYDNFTANNLFYYFQVYFNNGLTYATSFTYKGFGFYKDSGSLNGGSINYENSF